MKTGRRKKRLISILILFLYFSCIYGNAEDGNADGLPEGPPGYRGINLGMSVEEVKEHLAADPFFDFRGDPDVSFLPASFNTLIECEGNAYISRAYFQFYEGKLFIMIIELNQDELDYYTMFTTLSEKYQEPSSLDPSEAVWIFSNLRLSLEKPLTIKYIDRAVFDELKAAGKALEDMEVISREKFLDDF
jgi:hypothetical protein